MRQNLANSQIDLNVLVEAYAVNKNELDSYKQLCDEENKQIKAIMAEQSLDKFESDNYVAKITIQNRKSLNEEAAIEVLKNANVEGVIKTKEYIDFDALENAIYHERIDNDTLGLLGACETVNKVTTLKLTKRKKDE